MACVFNPSANACPTDAADATVRLSARYTANFRDMHPYLRRVNCAAVAFATAAQLACRGDARSLQPSQEPGPGASGKLEVADSSLPARHRGDLVVLVDVPERAVVGGI